MFSHLRQCKRTAPVSTHSALLWPNRAQTEARPFFFFFSMNKLFRLKRWGSFSKWLNIKCRSENKKQQRDTIPCGDCSIAKGMELWGNSEKVSCYKQGFHQAGKYGPFSDFIFHALCLVLFRSGRNHKNKITIIFGQHNDLEFITIIVNFVCILSFWRKPCVSSQDIKHHICNFLKNNSIWESPKLNWFLFLITQTSKELIFDQFYCKIPEKI